MTSLKPEAITCLVDSREQRPFRLEPLQTVRRGLQSGDYSILGMETSVALERKETGDLLACITHERPRFERELERLQGFAHRLIIVEGNWEQLASGDYRSKATPQSVTGSLLGWMSKYNVPILFAGDRCRAEQAARRWLYTTARREWEKAQAFAKAVQETKTENREAQDES